MRRLFIVLSSMLCLSVVWAQKQTILVGEVYDAETGDPIENVNIVYQGLHVGTTTNEEGFFYLRFDLRKRTMLVVSAIGYRTQRFAIEPGQNAGIDIAMEPQTTELEDVWVRPGVNPALSLMDSVRFYKRRNEVRVSPDAMDALTDVYVSDIRARHLQRRLWMALQTGMIEQGDSSYLLPLYHYQRQDGAEQEKALALASEDYRQLLGYLHPVTNFYRNTVTLYSMSFVSPLSSDGNAYYRYYLIDSIPASDTVASKRYVVDFRTRNPYTPTFNGRMQIDSATFALRAIEANVSAESNANFLRQLAISQHLDENGVRNETMTQLLDFAVRIDTLRTLPTVLLSRTYTAPSSGMDTCSEYSESRTSIASLSAAKIDSLQQTPVIRFAKWAAYIILNGYIPTGSYIEVGQINQLIDLTPEEGFSLGIPLRTSEKLWKNVCLEAYATYGFGDRVFKGSGMVHWQLPVPNRHIIHLSYTDDYAYSFLTPIAAAYRENNAMITGQNLTGVLTRMLYWHFHSPANSMARQQFFELRTEHEWTPHINQQISIRTGRQGYGIPNYDYHTLPSFRYSTLSTTLRLSWDDRPIDSYFRRYYAHGKLPVLYLQGEMGSYQTDAMESYNLYGSLRLLLKHNIPIGVAGRIDYALEAGMVFGRVPYTMLQLFALNDSYAFEPYRFSLMTNNRFAADKYLMLQFNYDGRGCLLGLIPGVRRLRLHELVSYKIAWGGLRDTHTQIVPIPDAYSMQAPVVPYMEMGVGLGNILRVCDLYSIWRLTYRDDPMGEKWAVRFRFHITP